MPGALAMADGLDEAARGLFRSARESFAEAAALAPDDPAPALAEAWCLLHMGRVADALIRLETAPALNPAPEPFAKHHAWLCAAAREAAGDSLGADHAADTLPPRLRGRVLASVYLRDGDISAGVRALIYAFNPNPRRHHE